MDVEIAAGDEDGLEDLSSLKKLIPNFTKRPRRRTKPMTRPIVLYEGPPGSPLWLSL
jgi:hypothetical protein